MSNPLIYLTLWVAQEKEVSNLLETGYRFSFRIEWEEQNQIIYKRPDTLLIEELFCWQKGSNKRLIRVGTVNFSNEMLKQSMIFRYSENRHVASFLNKGEASLFEILTSSFCPNGRDVLPYFFILISFRQPYNFSLAPKKVWRGRS